MSVFSTQPRISFRAGRKAEEGGGPGGSDTLWPGLIRHFGGSDPMRRCYQTKEGSDKSLPSLV